jgi:hypothetical protein
MSSVQPNQVISELNEVVVYSNKGIILVSDSNCPDIDRDIYHDNTCASRMFINLLKKKFITQHVDFPT